MSNNNRKTVLMADDDVDDCMLAREAFMESGAQAAFSCVEDGTQLMEYLALHSAQGAAGPPSLILLDLNMPGKDGRAALVEIKSHPLLRTIPVVILTTSGEPRDMDYAAQAGADSFVTKPATFDRWVEMMKSLAQTWLS